MNRWIDGSCGSISEFGLKHHEPTAAAGSKRKMRSWAADADNNESRQNTSGTVEAEREEIIGLLAQLSTVKKEVLVMYYYENMQPLDIRSLLWSDRIEIVSNPPPGGSLE